jgi:excisionase family DNA binding protein
MLQLMSLDVVAKSLGLSRHTVRSFVRQGRLKPTRVCRRLLFDPADVEAFIRKAQSTGPERR